MINVSSPATVNVNPGMLPTFGADLFINRAHYAAAPWLFTALQKLHDLSGASDVTQHSALKVSPSTVTFARATIGTLPNINLPTPTVCPVSGGCLGIVWTVGNNQLEMIFDADQRGTYVLSNGESIIDDGELDGNSLAVLQSALTRLLTP